VHVLIGVMHQGSGLLGTGAEMGLAMSHVFPPKDLMDEHAYTGIEMSVSPPACVQEVDRFGGGSATMWAASTLQPQNKLSACLRKFNGSTS